MVVLRPALWSALGVLAGVLSMWCDVPALWSVLGVLAGIVSMRGVMYQLSRTLQGQKQAPS